MRKNKDEQVIYHISSSKEKKTTSKFIGNIKGIGTAPVDIMSVGHLAFGNIVFLIVFFIYPLLPKAFWEICDWCYYFDFFLIAFVIFFLWEILENKYILPKTFPYHKDSLLNSFFDIIFGFLGLVIAYFLLFWSIIPIVFEISLYFYFQSKIKKI